MLLEDDSFEITARNKITKKEFLQHHGQHAIERRRKEKRKKVKFLESQHANWSLTEEGSRPEGETREARNFSILGPNFLQWQVPRKGPIKDKLEKYYKSYIFRAKMTKGKPRRRKRRRSWASMPDQSLESNSPTRFCPNF